MLPSAEQLFASLANALALGSLIALVAVGYSLVYGVAKLVNFAHGEIFVLGGYYTLCFVTQMQTTESPWAELMLLGTVTFLGMSSLSSTRLSRGRMLFSVLFTVCALPIYWNLLVSATPLPISIAVACFCTVLTSFSLELVAYRPLLGSDRLNCLVSAVGASLVLQGTMQIVFGTQRRAFPESVRRKFLLLESSIPDFASQFVRPIDLLIIISALLITICVHLLIYSRRFGLAIRAVADNHESARSYGVSVERAQLAVFGIGAVVACVASVLFVARENALEPTFGYQQGILAFCAAVVGGIGRVSGAYCGGMFAGFVLTFLPYLPTEWIGKKVLGGSADQFPSLNPGDWSFGCVYGAMILVLMIRPRGLVGELFIRRV